MSGWHQICWFTPVFDLVKVGGGRAYNDEVVSFANADIFALPPNMLPLL